jgi:nucleoid-associated protein YgaU
MAIRNKNIKIARNLEKGQYAKPLKYPFIPLSTSDMIVITQEGDRLDILASTLYGDERYWWVIANANPDVINRDSYALKPGLEIRIPIDYKSIYDSFEEENKK